MDSQRNIPQRKRTCVRDIQERHSRELLPNYKNFILFPALALFVVPTPSCCVWCCQYLSPKAPSVRMGVTRPRWKSFGFDRVRRRSVTELSLRVEGWNSGNLFRGRKSHLTDGAPWSRRLNF